MPGSPHRSDRCGLRQTSATRMPAPAPTGAEAGAGAGLSPGSGLTPQAQDKHSCARS